MNIKIANRLVQLRKENNLSQEALAEKLGVSRQAVSKWERAEASPDTDNLIMLAKLYRISLDELLQINLVEDGAVEQGGGNEITADAGHEENIGKWEKESILVGDLDGEDKEISVERKEKERFCQYRHFPMTVVIIVVYLLIGCLANAWHPGWLLCLLIPIWESIVVAVRRKNASYFAYPVLATFLFLCTGIFYGRWHPSWGWFLTIPLYYSLVSYFNKGGNRNEEP